MLSDKAFCVVASALAVLGAFPFFVRYAPDVLEWPVCSGDQCTVAGWIGALSGWVGAVVGGGGLYFLWRQIDEQRKQTAFVLGDAMPTIDSLQHLDDEQEVVIRLVNWNRRSLVVHAIGMVGYENTSYLMALKFDGQESSQRRLPLTVEGWIDRGNPPHMVQCNLSAVRLADDEIVVDWPPNQMAYVDLQIIGDHHKAERFTCYLSAQQV